VSAHARLSASSAHRWLVCAGSINPGAGTTSSYAAEGTFAHDIAAKCLTDGTPASEFLGKRGVVDGFDIECGLEMVQAVQDYIDAIEDDRAPGDQTWVEMPLLAPLQKIDADLGGTADFVRYRKGDKTLRVYDFKYGSGTYVEAASNKQMTLYALGAMLQVGAPIVQVDVTIVQPRFEGARPIRSWVFAAVDILDFVADVKVAADLSRTVAVPRVAGDHCHFCPNAGPTKEFPGGCPELERRHHALVAGDFAEVSTIAPAKIASALESIPLVKVRIKAIEEAAYALATSGVEIPGFKLVDKRPVRKWRAEGEVIVWAQNAAVDPYAAREILSPAQLEKRLAESAPRGKKKEAGAVLVQFIEKVSSGTALVPVSDDRQPAKLVSAEDFAVLPGP